VQNVFLAKSADYQKATIRVYHTDAAASYVSLPIGNGK
jgi:hypothetical protein